LCYYYYYYYYYYITNYLKKIKKTNILREQIKSDMSALNSAYNKLKSQVDGYLSEIQVSLKENI